MEINPKETQNFSSKSMHEVVLTLDKGRITRNSYIRKACKLGWETGYWGPLQKLLKEKPWLLTKAWRNILEQLDYPFWPPPMKQDEINTIKGKYQIGYVNSNKDMAGLDPLDFTQGLTIFGETGSGKTYPVLMVTDQILSTPIEERGFKIYERGDYRKKPPSYQLKILSEGKPEKIDKLLKELEKVKNELITMKLAVVDRRGEIVYYGVDERELSTISTR